MHPSVCVAPIFQQIWHPHSVRVLESLNRATAVAIAYCPIKIDLKTIKRRMYYINQAEFNLSIKFSSKIQIFFFSESITYSICKLDLMIKHSITSGGKSYHRDHYVFLVLLSVRWLSSYNRIQSFKIQPHTPPSKSPQSNQSRRIDTYASWMNVSSDCKKGWDYEYPFICH